MSAKKYRVSLGARQSCTCPAHLLTGELCHHILWAMLRVFRVPEQADLLYQLALTDREVEGLLEFRRISTSGSRAGTRVSEARHILGGVGPSFHPSSTSTSPTYNYRPLYPLLEAAATTPKAPSLFPPAQWAQRTLVPFA